MAKNKKQQNQNCTATSASCVVWDMDPIPCLGIKYGDKLDVVTFALAKKICEATGNDIDLTEIDLQCVIEKLNVSTPVDKSLVSLLQIAFSNDCKLYDLIQSAQGGSSQPPLQLNLKCLGSTDIFGNQMTYDQQTVLQMLINDVCLKSTQITQLTNKTVSLQDQIDSLSLYTEPTVPNTCLYSNRNLSQAYIILASDYCAWKQKVGLTPVIDQAIGAQPDILADPDFPVADLIVNPIAGFESVYNNWVFTRNLYTRLLNLESCACKAKCSDIVLAWQPIDVDETNIQLRFSGDYGNYIPIDYDVDTDSKIIFIDVNGIQRSYPIPIGNDNTLNTEWETPLYDLSTLDTSHGMITIKVCVKLKNIKTGEICCKCEEKEHKFTGGCSFCEITAVGDVEMVFRNCTIVDKGQSNCVYQAVKLSEGQMYVIPSTYELIAVDNPDNIAENTCLNLDTVEELGCYIATVGNILTGNDSGLYYNQANSGTSSDGQYLVGYRFNNVDYMFSQQYEPDSVDGANYDEIPFITGHYYPAELILSELKMKQYGIISYNYNQVTNDADSNDSNYTQYWQIKTTEELAKNLFLITKVRSPHSWGHFLMYTPFQERSEVITRIVTSPDDASGTITPQQVEDELLPESLCETPTT